MKSVQLTSLLRDHHTMEVRRLSLWTGPCDADRVASHDHAGLAFYLKGEATFWQGATHRLRAGDCLLIPAGHPHYMVECSQVEVLGLALCLPCLRELEAGAALARAFDAVWSGASPVRRPSQEGADRLQHALLALERELSQPRDASFGLATQSWLGLVAAEVLRALEPGPAAPLESRRPLVADALRYIRAHALQDISLRDVAGAVARSPNYVASVIKAETGHSVGQWITSVKMAHVRQWLLHSQDSLENIAERAGFYSSSHFYKVFRRFHGATPAAWRRQHRASYTDTRP